MQPNSIPVYITSDEESAETRFYTIKGVAEFEVITLTATLKSRQTWQERESAIFAGIMALVGAEDMRELALHYSPSIDPYAQLSELRQ